MKIKSPIGFLALWSAFLAAGTWMLPVGGLALSSPSVAAASPLVIQDSDEPLLEAQQRLTNLLSQGELDRAAYVNCDIDINIDGTPEIIEVTPSPVLGGPGMIRVVGGVGGVERFRIHALPDEHLFGEVVGVIEDLDADGHRELLIVTSQHLQNGFRLIGRVHSGHTGELLALFEDENDLASTLGAIPVFEDAELLIAGDMDGDRRIDLPDVVAIDAADPNLDHEQLIRLADLNVDGAVDSADTVRALLRASDAAGGVHLAAVAADIAQIGEVTLLAPPGSTVISSSTSGGGGAAASAWVGGPACSWQAAKLIATVVFMLAQLVACGSQTAAGLPCWVNLACRVARAINRLLEFLNTCYAPPPAGWIVGAHDIINVAGAICQLFTGDFKKIIDWLKRFLKWYRGEAAALNMAAMRDWSPGLIGRPPALTHTGHWA